MAEVFKRQFWGGFIDGKLDLRLVDTGFGGWGNGGFRVEPALFMSKRFAQEQYEDVRRVNVSTLAPR